MSNAAIVSSVLSKHNVPYIVIYASDLSSIRDVIPETIDVAGIARPTHNSRDQLIHPTLDGIKNFWNWFGSSKIVDEHGRPAVYYHGTSKDVSSFVPNDALGGLIFAAPTAKEAAVFAGNNLGSNVMPVYIKASKPYPRGCLASDEVRTAAKAKSLGYDAIYVHDTIADPYNIGVFSPNQIKSALGNNGKFSSNATEVTASVPLTSAKLRRLINSKQAYAILDSTVGGTWLEGGCALLAVALSDLGYGELFVLVGKSRGSTITQVQHWLVKTPSGMFIDGDGVSSERSLLRRWYNDEDIDDIQLRPAVAADKKGETWESATYTDALAKLKNLLASLSANEATAASHRIPSLDDLDEAERAEFDRWSLAGLIRDDSGKPLLLFHGGNEELRDDDWWTPDLRNTREFGYITHCAYLRMNNPAREEALVDSYNKLFGTEYDWDDLLDVMDTTPADFLEQNQMYFEAVRKDYDGFIIFDNSLEHPGLAYRVFDVDTDAWVLGTVS